MPGFGLVDPPRREGDRQRAGYLSVHNLETQLLRMDFTEELAGRDSPVHRLDPRTKIVVTLVFAAVVASYPRYTVSALVPFAFYPLLVASLAQIPWSYLGQRLLVAAPFVLALGLLNPLIDREPVLLLGTVAVSGGWVSCFSIMLRGLLCVSAAVLLLATTGIYPLGGALRQLHVPAPLVTQILFLYRYLFLVMEEGLRMVRASRVRAPDRLRLSSGSYAHLVGSLLIRAVNRAERVHLAMRCRGFRGQIPMPARDHGGVDDLWFAVLSLSLMALLRAFNVPVWLGRCILEVTP